MESRKKRESVGNGLPDINGKMGKNQPQMPLRKRHWQQRLTGQLFIVLTDL
jgi:hypothetical protein